MLYPTRKGKIRQIYDLDASDELFENGVNPWAGQMVIVTSDHISAFDHVLPDCIPHKGQSLNLITAYFKFFKHLRKAGPNDLISIDVAQMPEQFQNSDYVGRTALVRKTTPIPIECIVRAYNVGSGYRDYVAKNDGTVYGQWVGLGLYEGSRFEHPIFTPTTKADEGEHDENIPLEELPDKLAALGFENAEENAEELERLSLEFFEVGDQLFKEQGLLLADCKMEFGWHPEQGIMLIDEFLTPDCARIYDQEAYFAEGKLTPGIDKDIVRNKLRDMGWDGDNGNPPHLPAETIADATRVCELNLYKLTGHTFDEFAANGFQLEPEDPQVYWPNL